MMKKRGGEDELEAVLLPTAKSKRTTRSRLRHPKIAIPKKKLDKLRAFSINTDFDDEISIFSRECEEPESVSPTPKHVPYFRSNSHFEDKRVETPGFMTEGSKYVNTTNRNGTTETRHTSTYTTSSAARPESALRFRHANLVRMRDHDKSFMPGQISLFDASDDFQPDISNHKSAEGFHQSKTTLNRFGKVLSRHRRIESVINAVDPFRLQNKRIIFKNKR